MSNAVTLPWGPDTLKIGSNPVGTMEFDVNANLSFNIDDGTTFGPYPSNLNTQSGSLANTSTCDSGGCLTINGVTYDFITGNIEAHGGHGALHIKESKKLQEVAWTADDSAQTRKHRKHRA